MSQELADRTIKLLDELPYRLKGNCPPHWWYIESNGMGYCVKDGCHAIKDFSKFLYWERIIDRIMKEKARAGGLVGKGKPRNGIRV